MDCLDEQTRTVIERLRDAAEWRRQYGIGESAANIFDLAAAEIERLQSKVQLAVAALERASDDMGSWRILPADIEAVESAIRLLKAEHT